MNTPDGSDVSWAPWNDKTPVDHYPEPDPKCPKCGHKMKEYEDEWECPKCLSFKVK